ncbi:PIN domain-containing protein [Candidatus Woesearchaeota archaeon]|nr:PIN domain-containing protein [Candidatus Woesearchaeota archaeon]
MSALNLVEVFDFVLKKRLLTDAQQAASIMQQVGFVIPVDVAVALAAGSLKKENSFGMVDAIIYATAQLNKATLVTVDSDFAGKTGVVYISS